jgi:rhamnulokinase
VGRYLAVDLGATSGRVTAGRLADGHLEVREVHRFANRPFEGDDGLRWDVEALFEATLTGLGAGIDPYGGLDGIATSTWGVDYGLVDDDGRLLEPPGHYRSADRAAREQVLRAVPAEELFARTGVLPQPINTVFRLGERLARLRLRDGTTALLMPDLWTFRLAGVHGAERTIAGTTGMLGAHTGDWDDALLARAGIDTRVLPAVVEPGQRAGTLRPELRDRLGLADDVAVLRSAGHDTAAAVAAVPGEGHVAYISCGTWSLAGVEHDVPVLDPAAMRAGFTNELGVGGRARFQRNLTGLWLLEEALRQWGTTTAEAVAAAEREGPVASRIDVGDPEFIATGDVLARIADACRRDGQAVPETLGQFTRCILESLAAAYGETIAACVELTGRPVDVVHMVGGGSRNALLCRLTAEACERVVLAGPAEATSLGNLLVQAMATGEIDSLDALRDVVRRSAGVVRYEPGAARVR